MKTFMANEQNISRKWYVVDATDMPMGRLASQVAAVLRGKNKPTFTPHVDCGDFVIVINSDKIALTGKKLENKYKSRHTLYMGGLKQVQYKKLMEEKSDEALYLAIKGMLPKNKIANAAMTRIRVSAGQEHAHQAQKPEVFVK